MILTSLVLVYSLRGIVMNCLRTVSLRTERSRWRSTASSLWSAGLGLSARAWRGGHVCLLTPGAPAAEHHAGRLRQRK
jgi:hypothetical protein